MAPTCFGPFGLSSGSIRRNLAKVTVFVEIISKNTSLKLLLCSGNMCFCNQKTVMLSRTNRYNYVVVSYCGMWQHVFFGLQNVTIC
jgi:hypothetical protein